MARAKKIATHKANERKPVFTSIEVSRMAQSQDDLDMLFAAGAPEIIICGNKLHIPLVKQKVLYIGIDNPTVVIDSNKIINFDALGIKFVGCLLDENYRELINVTVEDKKEGEADSPADIEYDQGEIQDFYDSLQEFFRDFREELSEMSVEEDVEDHISFEELTSSDYGSDDYMYESKARARLACKAAINEMLLTVKTELITGAKSYLICSEEFCSALRSSFDEFVSDLSNAYDSYAVECSESLEAYIMSRKKEMFSVINPKKGGSTVSGSEIEKSISAAIDKILSARQLARKCDYDNDDDGDYCFCLDGACDDINQEVAGFVSGLENELPARIETECKNAILRQLEILNGKFDDIFAE